MSTPITQKSHTGDLSGTHEFIIPYQAISFPLCVATVMPDSLSSFHISTHEGKQNPLSQTNASYIANQFYKMFKTNKIIGVLLTQIESNPHPFFFRNTNHSKKDHKIYKLGFVFADPLSGYSFFLPFNYTSHIHSIHEILNDTIYDCISESGMKLPLVFVKWLLNRKHLCVTSNVKQLIRFLLQEFGIHPICQFFDPLVSYWLMNPNQKLHQTYSIGSTAIIK